MKQIGLPIPVLLSVFILIFHACTLDKEPGISTGITNEIAPVFVSTDLERVGEHSVSAQALLSSFGNLNILRYGWVWSENPGPTLEDTEDSKIELKNLEEDSFRTEIPGLLSGKLYHICPYVTTGSGVVYGKEKKITLIPTFQISNYQGYGYYVQETIDGGFLLTGTTETDSTTLKRSIYLVKINSIGNFQWEKKVSLAASTTISFVRQTIDSGFILLGRSGVNLYLVKTNALGDIEWEKTLVKDGSLDVGSISQTRDGGFILLATNRTNPGGNITPKMYLVKTNSSGDTIWTNTFSGESKAIGYSVQETTDSGFILLGSTHSDNTGSKTYMVKTNASGAFQWDKIFGDRVGSTIQQTLDGGFIVLGSISGGLADPSQLHLFKIDAGGFIEWGEAFGGNDFESGTFFQRTREGGFILLGSVNQSKIYLVKTTIEGESQWERILSRPGVQRGRYVQQTTDGGFIVVGVDELNGSRMYVVKTDENGRVY